MQRGLQNWHYSSDSRGQGSPSPLSRLSLPTLDTLSGQLHLEGDLDFSIQPNIEGPAGRTLQARARGRRAPAASGQHRKFEELGRRQKPGGCLDSSSVAGRRSLSGSPLGARPSSLAARRLAPRQRRGPSAAHAPSTASAAPRPPHGPRLPVPCPQIGPRRPAGAAVTRERRT